MRTISCVDAKDDKDWKSLGKVKPNTHAHIRTHEIDIDRD